MPELPEVQALARDLDARMRGATLVRAELASVAALRTYDPGLSTLVGREVVAVARKGKFLTFATGEAPLGEPHPGPGPVPGETVWLVVHLARGGWVRWRERLAPERAKQGRGPLALRLGLSPRLPGGPASGAAEGAQPGPGGHGGSSGPGIEVTEAGTEKRLAIWVVRDLAEIGPLAGLGPDPLDTGFDPSMLAGILSAHSGQVKGVITDQRLIAGVGNAYSDEALHAARLSPFKAANRVSPEEVERLHAALVGVLAEALARSDGLAAAELKGEKRSGMAVHGRAGYACPVCGDIIREVSFATKSLQYCPRCQTGGKVLADRRLSRLLK